MHYLRILVLLLFPNLLSAQNDYAIARTFTTTDGLPSNNVYRCVEDNKGFLWVATDSIPSKFIWTIQTLDDRGLPAVTTDGNGQSRSEPFVFKIKASK